MKKLILVLLGCFIMATGSFANTNLPKEDENYLTNDKVNINLQPIELSINAATCITYSTWTCPDGITWEGWAIGDDCDEAGEIIVDLYELTCEND
ncbi:MAG: hypothetical protein IPH58_02075 [Sphingobacteriales bacterium]|jgi:hypothetical protein|nr:hypothetical protein [Sphingobacteriales bacterium]